MTYGAVAVAPSSCPGARPAAAGTRRSGAVLARLNNGTVEFARPEWVARSSRIPCLPRPAGLTAVCLSIRNACAGVARARRCHSVDSTRGLVRPAGPALRYTACPDRGRSDSGRSTSRAGPAGVNFVFSLLSKRDPAPTSPGAPAPRWGKGRAGGEQPRVGWSGKIREKVCAALPRTVRTSRRDPHGGLVPPER